MDEYFVMNSFHLVLDWENGIIIFLHTLPFTTGLSLLAQLGTAARQLPPFRSIGTDECLVVIERVVLQLVHFPVAPDVDFGTVVLGKEIMEEGWTDIGEHAEWWGG